MLFKSLDGSDSWMKIPCKQIEVQVYISDITCKFIDCYVSIWMKPIFRAYRSWRMMVSIFYYFAKIIMIIRKSKPRLPIIVC